MDDIQPFYPVPTAQVQPYVDALGTETAIEFLLNFGGAELTVSLSPNGRGMVERVIGLENTIKLGNHRDHMQPRVPLANKWLAQCLYAQSLSVASIARRLRSSDTTVRGYLRGNNARRANG
tara:strand:+ start:698 stop:1060 length:363 start_codon:yes stop_codon:yes gene_type:complete